MARVLMIWELGGDYGHIGRFLPLAHALRERGHEPVFVMRDLARAEPLLGRHGFRWHQAPLWLPPVLGLPAHGSYPETLMRFGFLDPAGLMGMVRAWRALVELLQPSLLLLDHSPTALLATTGMGIPRALYSHGFAIPPRIHPLPSYRWWKPEPPSRLADSENKVLGNINAVLFELGQAPLARLYQLFDTEECFLCVPPELDHYGARPGARYWAPVQMLDQGAVPQWPQDGRKRVFAYVKPVWGDFEKLLKAFAASDASYLVHAPGIAPKLVATWQSETLRFSAEPVQMGAAAAQCDAAVCHAGIGTVAAMLAQGKPLLLLPMQLEQLMMAKRVEALGAAVLANPEGPAPDHRKLVKRLLTDEALAERARAYAPGIVGMAVGDPVAPIAARCEALIGTG